MVAGESGEVGNPGTLGMTKERATLHGRWLRTSGAKARRIVDHLRPDSRALIQNRVFQQPVKPCPSFRVVSNADLAVRPYKSDVV